MSSAFVPFLPSGGKTAQPVKSIASGAVDSVAAATAFAALMPDQAGAAAAKNAVCAKGATAKPVVTLQKEGDRVTGIRIECGCGEVIELDCQY